ncbi:MAG: DUF885 domain-containing protein [Ilumatobacteraceae bacterium]
MALSPIFEFADRFVADQAALDPCLATSRGIPGYDDRLTDYSPDGQALRVDHMRRALADLAALEPADDHDRLAKDFIAERFETTLLSDDSGEWQRAIRAIAAPATVLRSTFDLMPRDGEGAWTNIAARLHSIPAALAGLRATYDHGRHSGVVAARRQVLAAADQCATWATNRWFDSLPAEAAIRVDMTDALQRRITEGAALANAAYGAFAAYLRDDYANDAEPADGCGPERYRVGVRSMLGADLDPQEMYGWAWTDFHHLRAEIKATCERIEPGASFTEVIDLLDTDPARAEHGADAYQAWLQALTDEALSRSKEHFEIPEIMDRCEALIPPEGSAAAAYYTGPSEDFSRPGRTWYPTLGRTMFPRWGDVTTCYHESVPGHHLQIAYAKVQAGSLSRIQRGSFIPGHGEGWALYAEQLCDEFGWLENPDYRLGFLGGQILRTVRVIIDIGMHLGQRIPEGTTLHDGRPFHGGETWNPDLAFEFSVHETGRTETFMRSEIDRYLGWPAQAISYKIGQREWQAARDDARARDGAGFDLRQWHTKALRLGAIGLGQLRAELAR